ASDQPHLPGLVQGYFGDNNPFGLSGNSVADGRYVINPQFEWCGGGFLSTSADLACLARAIHDQDLIPAEVHQQQVQAVNFRTGEPAETGYGLGTFVWKTDLGLFYGHAGIMPGYLTQVEYSPEHGFAVALQCNSDADMGQHHHTQVQKLAQVVTDYLQQDRD
ncbi:MAG: serine hydrolase, partial [Pirellulaceae bacterium]